MSIVVNCESVSKKLTLVSLTEAIGKVLRLNMTIDDLSNANFQSEVVEIEL